ncbi:MAG TPA: thioesterase family protein [Acetobacteraceae bacterium]
MRAGLSPFKDHSATVLPEWIDDNGHMNLAYYVLVFDGATDVVCEAVGLGATHRRQTRTSVFAVETHILYRAELLLGDHVTVHSQIIAADAKRMHLAHEMHRNGDAVAFQEVMLLHVSLNTRRATPFPPGITAQVSALAADHAKLPRPAWLGRRLDWSPSNPSRGPP